jgi:hypothetical protein
LGKIAKEEGDDPDLGEKSAGGNGRQVGGILCHRGETVPENSKSRLDSQKLAPDLRQPFDLCDEGIFLTADVGMKSQSQDVKSDGSGKGHGNEEPERDLDRKTRLCHSLRILVGGVGGKNLFFRSKIGSRVHDSTGCRHRERSVIPFSRLHGFDLNPFLD